MDFTAYTDDELADIQGDLIREAESRADDLPAGANRGRVRSALKLAHLALSQAQRVLVDGDIIEPQSGGEIKPPEGP